MATRSFSKHVRTAEKKLAQSEKKQGLRPVVIEGSIIARTWWGKAWNKNLESYADYTNRIGRGRSYLRSGAVLDLQVSAGEIKALVQGSRAKPYAITITIKKLNKNTWNLIASACAGKLESLEELLAGPLTRRNVHTIKDGLFPSPKRSIRCYIRTRRACAGTLRRRSITSAPGLTKIRSFCTGEVWMR
jgi:hypothetical protein